MNLGSLRMRSISLPWVEARVAANGSVSPVSICSSERALAKKADLENLWLELLSDSPMWRNRTSDNSNPRFPDFKFKQDLPKALWLDSNCTPPWVEAKLAATDPWALESALSSDAAVGYGGKKAEVENLWRELFSEPADWRDHRWDKSNSSFPDFRHKKHTKKALWLNSKLMPPWVEGKLAELPPGSIQLSTFSRNQQLSRHVQARQYGRTMKLFQQMQLDGNVDKFTFVQVLKACSNGGLLQLGRRVHTMIPPGFEADIFIGNTLVDMYAKCGSIQEAERFFKEMPTRDVVTFNAMISGYLKCGEGQKALELFEQMQGQGVDPDPITFAGVLNSCACVATLEVGRRVHEDIICRGYESDVVVGNCLVDMYAKCGSIEEAERVFKQMPSRNVVTLNAMLAGYGIHGYFKRALETFKQMSEVVEVDSITFLSLLSACSHGGLVAEGLEYFRSMSPVYNITPTVEHFACVVDLLGRAGRLGEAEDLIMSMPMNPTIGVWMALLGACKEHVNVEVGERCAKQVLQLEPDNAAAYVLLSNIYVV